MHHSDRKRKHDCVCWVLSSKGFPQVGKWLLETGITALQTCYYLNAFPVWLRVNEINSWLTLAFRSKQKKQKHTSEKSWNPHQNWQQRYSEPGWEKHCGIGNGVEINLLDGSIFRHLISCRYLTCWAVFGVFLTIYLVHTCLELLQSRGISLPLLLQSSIHSWLIVSLVSVPEVMNGWH